MLWWLLLFAGPCVGSASAAPPHPVIDWASQPVRPNETVLLLGGPFSSDTAISVVPRARRGVRAIVAAPLQPSNGSVKFVVPDSFPLTQFSVSVGGGPEYTLNGPQPWWTSGDLMTKFASPGGYVRVFGSCVFTETDAVRMAKAGLDVAQAAVAARVKQGRRGEADWMQLLDRCDAARALHSSASATSASLLRLTPATRGDGGDPITISSDPRNSTRWAAWFPVPADIRPGEYHVSLANALDPSNFVSLGAFGSYVSPTESNVTTITIVEAAAYSAARQPWKDPDAKRFQVNDYGLCEHLDDGGKDSP